MSGAGFGDREARLRSVIAGVVRSAVRDAGATGIVLVDDGSPEAGLARAWCEAGLGAAAVLMVPSAAAGSVESALQQAVFELAALGSGVDRGGRETDDDRSGDAAAEAPRALARVLAAGRGALVAGSANKSALLLTRSPAPEPLLPLGDLWASQVKDLAGDWSAPLPVRELADAAGGIEALDRALVRWCDRREGLASALRDLPAAVRPAVREALGAARFARRRVGIVPKLGPRTPGIDLFA